MFYNAGRLLIQREISKNIFTATRWIKHVRVFVNYTGLKLTDEESKDIIMMGDLNADLIASKPCKYTRTFIHATRLHGLSQLIKEPTSVTERTKTAIDLVFVKNLHRIVSHHDMECKSSQPVIILSFCCQKSWCLQGPRGNLWTEVIQALQQRTLPRSVVESFDDYHVPLSFLCSNQPSIIVTSYRLHHNRKDASTL